jgi:putative SOS response-associated peptidase YedK
MCERFAQYRTVKEYASSLGYTTERQLADVLTRYNIALTEDLHVA